MRNEERIKKTILNLQDGDRLYGHNFRISEEEIIYDENGNKVDLKEIIFGEFYANEMILHERDSDDRFLLAYEGITRLNVLKK
ncbi:hypothetical protein HBE96_00350 [Clostridium sp. P21]|uniref:Uncharacterized protein n=1 Tax=Clostridium muellerianum TaxID=2716538 RepID=A0A7Y0ED07_9CLOT|nr:hypothetical protein [Clostridium muellerianum]NMM61177.1 hypothetical protein [Clostridium muellerianum]